MTHDHATPYSQHLFLSGCHVNPLLTKYLPWKTSFSKPTNSAFGYQCFLVLCPISAVLRLAGQPVPWRFEELAAREAQSLGFRTVGA